MRLFIYEKAHFPHQENSALLALEYQQTIQVCWHISVLMSTFIQLYNGNGGLYIYQEVIILRAGAALSEAAFFPCPPVKLFMNNMKVLEFMHSIGQSLKTKIFL